MKSIETCKPDVCLGLQDSSFCFDLFGFGNIFESLQSPDSSGEWVVILTGRRAGHEATHSHALSLRWHGGFEGLKGFRVLWVQGLFGIRISGVAWLGVQCCPGSVCGPHSGPMAQKISESSIMAPTP